MSIPGSAEPLLLAQQETGGYQIQRSLRFNSSDSAYLSRTPASAGNRKTWTWAGWVKLGALGTVRQIFTSRPTSSPYALFYIFSDDKISFADNTLNTHTTAAVYRDPIAWYHIQLAVDTTNATAANRVRLWVNGTLQTWASTTAPTQNADGQINTATAHSIGSPQPYASSEYFNGYLADIHFIDGQALTPSSFTEVDATTGQLVPKKYTGSFGTNGFWLKFSDNSAATATTLGKDYSGNNNNFTPNNLSVVTGGPTSVAAASGALPILNTTGTYGDSVDTGVRTDANASSLVLAVPLSTSTGLNLTDQQPSGRTAGTKTLTNTGVTNSTTNPKFYGGGGAEFDSSNGDFLTIGSNSDFAFGTGDFTIEFWAYPNVSRSNHIVFATNFSNNSGLLVALDTSTNYRPFVYLGGWYYGASNTLRLNSWNHVAVVRSSGTLYFYVNGVRDSGQAFTATNDASNVQIGRNPTFGAESFNGFLQDLRVYKGAAKYTSNFNPPSSTQNATVAAGNDSLVDTPTSYGTDTGVGGEVRGNYCTWNPLKNGGISLSNGNLDTSGPSATWFTVLASFGITSGKWYWEIVAVTSSKNFLVGIAKQDVSLANYIGSDALGWGYYSDNGNKWNGGAQSGYGAAFAQNDVVGIAFDADNGTLTFYKNGTNQGTAFTGLTSGPYFPAISCYNTQTNAANFGQRPFAYTAPSGFKALCDTNIVEGTITTSGSFTGNANVDGPFVWLNGVPTAMTINGNSVTFGTHADKLSNGFKLRTSNTSYNLSGSNTYSITSTGSKFKYARAQANL